jgi:uncharacterized membrane protein (UPF0127 family)
MVINWNTGAVLAYELKKAESFWQRFLGLMPYKELPAGEGMLLSPCQSVHTFFMRFAIDVIYLDTDKRIVEAYPNVKPWRVLPFNRRSRSVLELAPGTLLKTHTDVGHHLNFSA